MKKKQPAPAPSTNPNEAIKPLSEERMKEANGGTQDRIRCCICIHHPEPTQN